MSDHDRCPSFAFDGKIRVLAPGAFADIIVADGNPLKSFAVLSGQGEHLTVIMKGERFHKNRLA